MACCNSCNTELTDDNWQEGWKKYGRKQCKDCHDKETRNKTCRRRTKTSNGMKLLEC